MILKPKNSQVYIQRAGLEKSHLSVINSQQEFNLKTVIGPHQNLKRQEQIHSLL
jgi:hypothetical protein